MASLGAADTAPAEININGRAAIGTLTFLGFALQVVQVGLLPLLGREELFLGGDRRQLAPDQLPSAVQGPCGQPAPRSVQHLPADHPAGTQRLLRHRAKG